MYEKSISPSLKMLSHEHTERVLTHYSAISRDQCDKKLMSSTLKVLSREHSKKLEIFKKPAPVSIPLEG